MMNYTEIKKGTNLTLNKQYVLWFKITPTKNKKENFYSLNNKKNSFPLFFLFKLFYLSSIQRFKELV